MPSTLSGSAHQCVPRSRTSRQRRTRSPSRNALPRTSPVTGVRTFAGRHRHWHPAMHRRHGIEYAVRAHTHGVTTEEHAEACRESPEVVLPEEILRVDAAVFLRHAIVLQLDERAGADRIARELVAITQGVD